MPDPHNTEKLDDDRPPHVLVRECRLTVVGGERDGTVHELAMDRVVVGADPSADLAIDDAAMSKFHIEIRIEDGISRVRDLGSKNGTTVDRVPIIEAPLRDGALLGLGRTQLRFDIGTRHVAIPLSPNDHFGRLRGRSVAMRRLFATLETVAPTDVTLLLQGESGAGKDLAAEGIHRASARANGPFVVVDCGAIPANLLEAELFGYEAGAFTGAAAQQTGAFEAAHGGTLFLDEIGELALDLQPKLLRAVDRREIQRIGSSARIATDVRVIAATNRNLRAEVNARRFRSDLFFRLAVVVVTLPPLRERASDLPMLVDALLADLGEVVSAPTPMARALRGELMPELLRHAWPGNVRELRNYIEACLVRSEPAQFDPAADPHAPPAIDTSQPLKTIRDRYVRYAERHYLEQLLERHGGNVSAAARAAGVDRVHLHRLLRTAGLRRT